MKAAPCISIEKLWFGYKPGQWVLRDVSLEIPRGSLNMMMGSSGSGKTTLLKVLGGFLIPQKGRIVLLDQEIKHGLPSSVRMQVGYIPQQLGLVRNLTVLENVLIGSLCRNRGLGTLLGWFPKKEIQLARQLLKQLHIGRKEDEKVIRLSGGERQRVAIARTLMQKPSLILADEFVSDLDLKTASEILHLVRDIGKKEQVTFLMSMHEVQLVKELGGKVFTMKEGRMAA